VSQVRTSLRQPVGGDHDAGEARKGARPKGRPAHRVMPARLELRLLNGFEFLDDGRPVFFPLSVQRLLAFLALNDRALQRVYVAGKLWLDTTEERAFANLRSTLWRANQSGHRLVSAVSSQLALSVEVRVDVHAARAQGRRLVDGSAAADELTLDRLVLAGELLPDWYDDWVLVERERYRQLALHALEALSARLVELGRYGEAADAALAAIAGEPLRESAHRTLIAVHLAEGNSGEALRQYELYRDMLNEGLNLAPSPRIEELVEQLTRR
jgi:DNA-binding SARP family transcriptional activator